MQSKTSSQLINKFREEEHQQGLYADKRRITQLHQFMKRRSRIAQLNKKNETKNGIKYIDDHKISLEDFVIKYKTNLKTGLNQNEAFDRLEKNGPNILSEPIETHWSIKLLRQFFTSFTLLIWIGSALSFITYFIFPVHQSNLYVGIALAVINIITGFLTFSQNCKRESMMHSFKDFIPPETIVIRDGYQKKIFATQLVVGDLVKIQLGKKIPADMRIIYSNHMKVDNSPITGDLQLLQKSIQCTNDNPLQTENLVFFSTLNRQGEGKGIVYRTGDQTVIGQMTKLKVSEQITPQQPSINNYIKIFIIKLTLFTVSMSIILFCLGFILGYPANLNLNLAIGIITANAPHCMIIQLTVCLIIGAKRLSKQKILSKYLESIYTLGSVSCICSEKTGVLTQNKMTAVHLWYGGQIKKAANKQKYGEQYRYEYDSQDPGFQSFHQSAVLSSNAQFDRQLPYQKVNAINYDYRLTQADKKKKMQIQKTKWKQYLQNISINDTPVRGNYLQSGLIKFFQPISDILQMRQRFPVVLDKQGNQCRLQFQWQDRYAYVIREYNNSDSHYCLFTKGAPQKIWNLCTHIDINGQPIQIDEEWKEKFKNACNIFGQNGQRTLAYCKYHFPKDKYPQGFQFNLNKINFQLKKQCFVGILSLFDFPKDNVPFSVLKCQSAGIKVIMITGDSPIIATATARQCNIINQQTVNQIAWKQKISCDQAFYRSDAIVIHGDQVNKMLLNDEGLPELQKGKQMVKWLSKSQIVFARSWPIHKLTIVKYCQKLNYVVAVTGDGIGDSSALKKADIGISMGINSTDIAKDAADILLLNNNFNSIIIGIQDGRRIFDNLKKSICYTLTSQVSQMLPFVGFVLLQFPLPITIAIVLYISIAIDFFPVIALAYQLGQVNIMTRKPRKKDQDLITLSLISQAYGYIGCIQFWGAIFCYYIVANDFGLSPSSLQFSANINIILPKMDDVYNPTIPSLGNSNIKNMMDTNNCDNSYNVIADWIYSTQASIDLRMVAFQCIQPQNNTEIKFVPTMHFGECHVQQISPYSNLPVCFTTQAIQYARSSYFYGIVLAQILNAFVCKTRRMSILTQGINNKFLLFAFTIQIMLLLLAAYFQPFNIAFGTRDTIFIHFGIAVIPFALLQLTIDQIKKFIIRNLQKSSEAQKPHWFIRTLPW